MFLLAACLLAGMSIVSAAPVSEPSLLVLMQDVKSAIRQAQARYDSGNVTGAADLARKILAKYPDNADAKAILDQCIATEREEYEKAVGSMSVTELANFQKKYPESEYGVDVSNRIADLPLWLDAKDKNTLDSYKQYLSESTHQIYKSDADDAIAELTVKQAYDSAVAANTIKAFEQFRSKYPDSAYDKQASNKIARLMADKFNSRSTYTDKNNALAYAKNEMTRDYVNNKYNKATEKKYSSSSSSSYSGSTSSSSSGYNRSTSTASTVTNKNVSNPAVMFGIDASLEWYPNNSFLGVGPIIRIGRYQSPIFATIAAKYSYASYKSTYTDYSHDYYYGYQDITLQGSGSYLSLPVTINWDMLASLGIEPGFYMGIGYVYNALLESQSESAYKNPSAWLLQMGGCGRHFDFKFGATFYSKGFTNSNRVDDSILFYLGMSYFF